MAQSSDLEWPKVSIELAEEGWSGDPHVESTIPKSSAVEELA